MAQGRPVKSSHIIDVLKRRHSWDANGQSLRYCFFDELRINTGFDEGRLEHALDENGDRKMKLVPNVTYDGDAKAWTEDGTYREIPDLRPREDCPNRRSSRLDAWMLDTWPDRRSGQRGRCGRREPSRRRIAQSGAGLPVDRRFGRSRITPLPVNSL